MSDPRTSGEPIGAALLQRRRVEQQARHQRSLQRVGGLLETQRRLGAELGEGLTGLSRGRDDLERLERGARDGSLLATLVRPFTARRTALARRSVAEGLFRQYEAVSVRLREASAFTDELRLCALELQQEVDGLHRDVSQAKEQRAQAARRVLEAERALAEAEAGGPESRARAMDRHGFELRTATLSLELCEAAIALAGQHLPAARQLRDTVLSIHEDMARYVLQATHTVNAAGRRIQGLGMLADAPVVVAELQEGLASLDLALAATQDYVERSRELVARVLPELTARLGAEGEAEALALQVELAALDRERSRRAAERALREAAEAELDALLGDDG